MRKFISKIFRTIYHLIPIKYRTKQKFRDKLVAKFTFLKRFTSTNQRYIKKSVNDINFLNIKDIDEVNKKIAVHLHLYYEDLSDEFILYLDNIKYQFDLLLSVQNLDHKEEIENNFRRLKNVNKIIIKETKNIGRDFSPMFITFKDEILTYDYLLHMHTKKSLRMGSEQRGWRGHMLDGVLGSEEIVTKIISSFENDEKMGLIYPESYDEVLYWGHTFLSNLEISNMIASRLGFEVKDKYIDFSAGSFFWCRVDAIKKFLELNFTWEDFGEEKGLADGTLAHAIERMILQACIHNGYSYLVIDPSAKLFRHKGLKNFYQYYMKNKNECFNQIKDFDIISFDIYDTLITRNIYDHETIYDILGKDVLKKYNIKDFKNIRLNALKELEDSDDFKGEVTIDEIYNYIQDELKLNNKVINEIKNMEIDLEIKFAYPKKDMLDIFNKLKKYKREIVLISDTNLTSEIMLKILDKCGYTGDFKLLLSSETKLRKETSALWDDYFKKLNKKTEPIHVGANEKADIQLVGEAKKNSYHVIEAKKMFELSDYSDYLLKDYNKYNNLDNIALGLMINKRIYNSPFINDCNFIIENSSDFSYTFIAPIIYNYFNYLDEKIKENKYNKLLFLDKNDVLRNIYKEYTKIFKITEVDNLHIDNLDDLRGNINKKDKVCLVDFMTNDEFKDLDGVYFTLDNNTKYDKNIYYCYDSNSKTTDKNIFKFRKILEHVLTTTLDNELNGIYDFLSDLSEYSNLTDKNLTHEFVCNNYSALIYENEIIKKDDGELIKIIDDLKKQYKKKED